MAVPTQNLRALTWRNLEINNDLLLVKILFTDSMYEVLIVDLLSGTAWYELLTAVDIQARTKELNPSIEISVAKLLQRVSDIVNSCAGDHASDTATFLFDSSDECTSRSTLTVSFKLAGLPFVWQFYLISVNGKILSEHLIAPLMIMNAELMRQRQSLFALLKAKDREIEDLRAQSVQSSRIFLALRDNPRLSPVFIVLNITTENLETKTFDEASFQRECQSSQALIDLIRTPGRSTFNAYGQQLFESISTAALKLEEKDVSLHKVGGGACASEESISSSSVPRLSPTQKTAQNNNAAPQPNDTMDSQEEELMRRQELEKKIAEKGQKRKKKMLKI